jgi:hypothetical protein
MRIVRTSIECAGTPREAGPGEVSKHSAVQSIPIKTIIIKRST